RTWAKAWGFVFHFANGIAFAIGYGLFFEVIGRSDWWLGAVAGFLHAIFVLTVLIPVIPDVHPRMASEDEGPDATPMLQPPGFLAMNYGPQTPLATVLAHMVYGAILAAEGVLLAIPVHEVGPAELSAHGVDRARDAGVVAGQEVHDGDLQERGVELGAAEGPNERVAFWVEAVLEHRLVHGVPFA